MDPKLLMAACLLLSGCGLSLEKSAKAHLARQAQVRTAEYLQAQRSGDLLGLCVKSNLVSAAYRDAGDAANAEAWRAKNAADCQAAKATLLPDQAD